MHPQLAMWTSSCKLLVSELPQHRTHFVRLSCPSHLCVLVVSARASPYAVTGRNIATQIFSFYSTSKHLPLADIHRRRSSGTIVSDRDVRIPFSNWFLTSTVFILVTITILKHITFSIALFSFFQFTPHWPFSNFHRFSLLYLFFRIALLCFRVKLLPR